MTRTTLPAALAALVLLAGCAGSGRSYGPGPYSFPSGGSYAPIPIPLPAPSPLPGAAGSGVTATPLLAPPGTVAVPDVLPPLDPLPAPSPEMPALDGPPPGLAAPGEPVPEPPSDPVTDLLLRPPGARAEPAGTGATVPAEPAAPTKAAGKPEPDSFMGFRPMRGQTRPATP